MTYDDGAGSGLYGPVTDWATDWDWLDERWGEHAPEIWADLRARGCPVAFTERYGRAFMPVTHEAVSAIAHDAEHFSSFKVSVSLPDAPIRRAPPITSDPPEHHGHRRVLLAPFSPRQIDRLEEPTRQYCRELIAALDGRDLADAAVDYAQHIPVHVICDMIGVPEADADVFRDWVFRNFQLAPRDNAAKSALQSEMAAYFGALLDSRHGEPHDDLAGLVAGAEIDGESLPRELQLGYLMLLILAGIDTTWSGIGAGLWHFATNDGDRQRLASLPFDHPLWSTATEEVLRFYSPVTMARQVVADTEVAGCPVKAGEQVLLTFPAANRDPEAFDDADRFVIDRAVNRHAAFGLGIHRCVGSNLARLEMLVAFQEWLAAFPRYTLDDRSPVTWANGQVRGPRSIPVRLNR
jgi:cytochrome P450